MKTCEGFLRQSNLSSQISTWTELDGAWDIVWIKSKNGTLIVPQIKSFGPKNFQIPCMDQKVPFWQFFRQGRDGRALLVWLSWIPHRISKFLFGLGADQFLAMQCWKEKLERPHFFKVQSGRISVCLNSRYGMAEKYFILQSHHWWG